MFLTLLSTSALSSAALLLLACPTNTEPAVSANTIADAAPPGMVLLKKQRVVIGTEGDAAKEIILAADGGFTGVWAETPAHTVTVNDFYLMTTEVTNEQFAEYILASGSQPPILWAKDATDKARRTFLEETGKAREEARAAGRALPPKELFDVDTWWKQNWKESKWKVPTDLASLPVVQVSKIQAEAYARWAGLRLMTEFEFQRAVRGKTENLYPWGSDWDPDKVLCAENARDRLAPVGSRAEGASPEGIFDLAGGVWEWTSSKYLPFPKYKVGTIKISASGSSRTENLITEWDEALFVICGGSYKNGAIAARGQTRQGTYDDETTDALGFRCAASPGVGVDVANLIERSELPRSIRANYKFDMSLTVATDRWKWRKGEAVKRKSKAEKPKGDASEGEEEKPKDDAGKGKEAKHLENYAVITDYDYILFTPVAELPGNSPSSLGKKTLTDGPLVLGFLSTTLPLTSPALAPGTYTVGWRAAGVNRTKPADPKDKKDDEPSAAAKRPLKEDIEFDDKVENLVFMDSTGTPILAMPFDGVEGKRLKPGSMAIKSIPANEKKEIEAHEEIVISAVVPTGRNALLFDIKLTCPAGSTAGDWRTQ